MRNFILTWEEEDYISYTSIMTDATKEQVEELKSELSEVIKNLKKPISSNESYNPMKLDTCEQAIVDFFHSKKFVCSILTLHSVVEL